DLLPLLRREVEVRHVAAVSEARHRSREVAEVVELGGALVPEGLEVLRVDEVAHPHAVDIVAERVVLHRVADLAGVAAGPFLHQQVDVVLLPSNLGRERRKVALRALYASRGEMPGNFDEAVSGAVSRPARAIRGRGPWRPRPLRRRGPARVGQSERGA